MPAGAPKVRSYRGSQRSSTPFERRPLVKKRGWQRKITDVLIISTLAFILVYSLIVKAPPKVLINSTAYHPLRTYEQAADRASRGLNNKTKLSYDEGAIIESLKKNYPEITQASINLPLLGQTPRISLHIASPKFLLRSSGVNFIINEAGVTVPENTYKTAGLVVISEKSGLIIKPGQKVLSSDNIDFISQVIAQAKAAKVPIASIDLPPLAQEIDVRTTDSAYYVKFYLGADPLNQIGQWLAARHDFSLKHTTPSEYLDVRVAGKIYYK